jgi:hypothetical protein
MWLPTALIQEDQTVRAVTKMRISLGLAGAAFVFFAGGARAEPAPTRGVTLGLTGVLPLPAWRDIGPGAAPWVGAVLPAWGRWASTARAGWVGHFAKEQTVGSEVKGTIRYEGWEMPILLGVEYPTGLRTTFIFSGEIGYVLRRSRAEWEKETMESTDHGIGLAVGGGYRVGHLQARLQLFLPSIDQPFKYKALLAGLQWTLPL